jgi:hypothetical protein
MAEIFIPQLKMVEEKSDGKALHSPADSNIPEKYHKNITIK